MSGYWPNISQHSQQRADTQCHTKNTEPQQNQGPYFSLNYPSTENIIPISTNVTRYTSLTSDKTNQYVYLNNQPDILPPNSDQCEPEAGWQHSRESATQGTETLSDILSSASSVIETSFYTEKTAYTDHTGYAQSQLEEAYSGFPENHAEAECAMSCNYNTEDNTYNTACLYQNTYYNNPWSFEKQTTGNDDLLGFGDCDEQEVRRSKASATASATAVSIVSQIWGTQPTITNDATTLRLPPISTVDSNSVNTTNSLTLGDSSGHPPLAALLPKRGRGRPRKNEVVTKDESRRNKKNYDRAYRRKKREELEKNKIKLQEFNKKRAERRRQKIEELAKDEIKLQEFKTKIAEYERERRGKIQEKANKAFEAIKNDPDILQQVVTDVGLPKLNLTPSMQRKLNLSTEPSTSG